MKNYKNKGKKMRSTCIVKGVTLLYFNTVIRWTRFKDMNKRLGGDWTKSHLFLFKRMCAYCFINMQNLELGVIYGIARLVFITVLHRLINCPTPKTDFYNYLLEKLL